jgi:hypothetical protein
VADALFSVALSLRQVCTGGTGQVGTHPFHLPYLHGLVQDVSVLEIVFHIPEVVSMEKKVSMDTPSAKADDSRAPGSFRVITLTA